MNSHEPIPASINPDTEQWLIDRAVENTNGIYPEAVEWSQDEEQARADLVGILSDLHAGANISLSDIDCYLVAVIEAAERLRTTIGRDDTYDVGRNDAVRFSLNPTSGADNDTWATFLRDAKGWSVTVTTSSGRTIDLSVANAAEYDDDGTISLVGYLWDEADAKAARAALKLQHANRCGKCGGSLLAVDDPARHVLWFERTVDRNLDPAVPDVLDRIIVGHEPHSLVERDHK